MLNFKTIETPQQVQKVPALPAKVSDKKLYS